MATIPVQITWVTGQVVTAAQLNANVRDAVNFLLNPPQAALRQTVAQNLTSGSSTAITFDTEDRDTDGGHSTSSNTARYTAQTAGWFLMTGGVAFVSNATGVRQMFHAVNAAAQQPLGASQTSLSASSLRLVGSTIFLFLNVGDFYTVLGNQNSGGTLATDTPGGAQSYMTVDYRGTA